MKYIMALLVWSTTSMAFAQKIEPSAEQIEAMHRQLAPKLCTDDNGEVIASCIEPMVAAMTYTDEYMRSTAMKHALKDVFTSNEEIKGAKKRLACKKRGLELGKAKLGMSRPDVVECGWGFPVDEQRVVDKAGVSHTYLYPGGRVLSFFNNKVTRIQE